MHSFLDGGSPIPGRRTAATAHAVVARRVAASLPLVPTPAAELAQARAAAARVPFALEYPRVQDRGGSADAPFLREYLIHAPGGARIPGLRGRSCRPVRLGQYYDVQGMTWLTAPQFASPDQVVRVAGRTYDLYYEGQDLQMVAWREHGAVYWVRNSLTDALATASCSRSRSRPVPSPACQPPARVALSAAGVPGRPAARAAKSSVLATVGSIGGLVTLIAVPLVAILLLRRRRELREARLHVRTSVEGEARAGAILDAAGVPDASPAAARAAAPRPARRDGAPRSRSALRCTIVTRRRARRRATRRDCQGNFRLLSYSGPCHEKGPAMKFLRTVSTGACWR